MKNQCNTKCVLMLGVELQNPEGVDKLDGGRGTAELRV